MELYLSQHLGIKPGVLVAYGAFDISVASRGSVVPTFGFDTHTLGGVNYSPCWVTPKSTVSFGADVYIGISDRIIALS